MKLKKIFEDTQVNTDGIASTMLLFDKLKQSPAFQTVIQDLKMPVDKYNAIVRFAGLLGIPSEKFEDFMNNVKNIKGNE